MYKYYLFSLVIIIAVISGCGGGGGGSSSTNDGNQPVESAFSMSLAQPIVAVDENQTYELVLNFQHTNGNVSLAIVDIVTDLPTDSYIIETSANAISIVIHELLQEGNLAFKINGTDPGGKSDSVSLSLVVNNTSAITTLAQVTTLQNQLPSLLNGGEVFAVANKLSAFIEILQLSTSEELSRLRETAKTSLSVERQQPLTSILSNIDYAAKYQNLELDEIALNDILSQSKQNLVSYYSDAQSYLITLQTMLSDDVIAPFTDTPQYQIDESKGIVSQFWLNDTLGETLNEQWQFNQDHTYLMAILFPESSPCQLTQ